MASSSRVAKEEPNVAVGDQAALTPDQRRDGDEKPEASHAEDLEVCQCRSSYDGDFVIQFPRHHDDGSATLFRAQTTSCMHTGEFLFHSSVLMRMAR